MDKFRAVAIDGPAGAGKSTIGRLVAENLGYLFFDSGVMYRAVSWAANHYKVSPHDEHGLSKLATEIEIVVTRPTVDDGRPYTVLIDSRDVTWELRSREVEAIVSPVAAVHGVRLALVPKLRDIAAGHDIVMVGRDIGTVVLPDADIKIFLEASVEERAQRRHAELAERGEDVELTDIAAGIARRDKIDSERDMSPLRPAQEAYRVHSDGLEITQTLAKILTVIGALIPK